MKAEISSAQHMLYSHNLTQSQVQNGYKINIQLIFIVLCYNANFYVSSPWAELYLNSFVLNRVRQKASYVLY